MQQPLKLQAHRPKESFCFYHTKARVKNLYLQAETKPSPTKLTTTSEPTETIFENTQTEIPTEEIGANTLT